MLVVDYPRILFEYHQDTQYILTTHPYTTSHYAIHQLLCNTYPTSSSDAIAYLALGNQINKTRLRDAGALVVVMEALRGFCRSLVCAHTAYTAYAARLHSLLKLLTLLTLNLSPCDMHNINHFVRVNPRTYLLHIYLSHPPCYLPIKSTSDTTTPSYFIHPIIFSLVCGRTGM